MSRAFHFPRSYRLVGIYRGVVETGERVVLKHCDGENICICVSNVIFKQVCVSMSVLGCVSTMPQCHPVLYYVAAFYDSIFMSVDKIRDVISNNLGLPRFAYFNYFFLCHYSSYI